MDLRTQPKDISICVNTICQNKCKRYYELWKPSQMKSYINPTNEYDKNGKQKHCNVRLEEIWN